MNKLNLPSFLGIIINSSQHHTTLYTGALFIRYAQKVYKAKWYTTVILESHHCCMIELKYSLTEW